MKIGTVTYLGMEMKVSNDNARLSAMGTNISTGIKIITVPKLEDERVIKNLKITVHGDNRCEFYPK